MHILTLSTLFPNHAQPNFGIFVERQTRELASRDGVDVTMVNPIGVPPWPLSRLSRYAVPAALAEHEIRNGLSVYRPKFTVVPRVGGRFNPAAIAQAVLPLIRKIHAAKPIDVIDAEFFYPDGPAAMRIGKALNLPYSVKARGADIHHWGEAPGCRPQILQAADKAAGVLSVAEALKADMVALGMAGDKIRVHYTGCDQDIFKPSDAEQLKAKLAIKGPLIITIGALITRKAQHHTICALAMLPDTTLILAGSGPQASDYQVLAKRLGVADRVRFVGNVANADLPQYIAAADAMVLTSSSEGLANAWVESLACGTPIIISAAGGARELLRDPVAGCIVDADAEAIANAVKNIVANPPDRQAVRNCVSAFTWERNGDTLLEHFQAIIAQS